MRNFNNMQKSQGGFTLIELVMVIVILGVLAATALPKFMDLATDARAGVMRGVEGSMRAANTMLYAKAAAQGKTTTDGATSTVKVNGADLRVDFGYAADATVLQSVMDLSPASDFTVSTTAIQHSGAKTPASCQVGYAPAATSGAAPTYTLTVTDC